METLLLSWRLSRATSLQQSKRVYFNRLIESRDPSVKEAVGEGEPADAQGLKQGQRQIPLLRSTPSCLREKSKEAAQGQRSVYFLPEKHLLKTICFHQNLGDKIT